MIRRLSTLPFLLTLSALPALAEPLWPCGSRTGSDLLPLDLTPRLEDGAPITIDMSQMVHAPDDPMPQGGSYGHPPDTTNMTAPTDVILRVTLFDASCDAVVVDGQPVSADRLPPGATLAHSGPNAILRLGPDAYVILRGIPLTLWAEGAARQIHGTAFADVLQGTSGADVLVPGASLPLVEPGETVLSGPDLVQPGAGDDRIIFTSGETVIGANPPDSGTDTLDLRRFKRTDLTLSRDGADLLITTPDGTIRLVDQDSADGNIETVLLDGKTPLSAAELRAAAR